MSGTRDNTHRRRRLRGLIAAAVFSLAACATVNSTPDAPQVPPNERARAAQQHPQIVAQFGGAVEGPVAAYVSSVGEKAAAAAGVPGQCTFTVINSDVVNAFAVPGCYIYITRGILAIMNSEDELASVLGHEVGHVVADHSDRRQNTATLGTLGAVLVGVLTGSGDLMQAAGQAAQVYTLGYSRDQEFEADDLGVRYLAATGYNPFGAADMLGSLGVNDSLSARTSGREAANAIPAWARTHPLSAERVARANAHAQAAGAVRGNPPEAMRPYFEAIRGLIYGDDPAQGFVNGRTFAHPTLRIAFEAPQGFSLTNTASAVLIAGPNNLRAQFGAGALPQGGVEAHAADVLRQILGQTPAQVGQMQRRTTNGLETATLPARAQNQQGQVVDVAVTAYRVNDRAYHFITLAPANGAGLMAPMLASFRTLAESQAAALRARRIEAVQVGPRDSAETLARRMAFDTYQLERFNALNGREPSAPLRAGEWVKIVVYER